MTRKLFFGPKQGPSDPENPDPNISEDQPVAELEDNDPQPEETQAA